MFLRSRVMSWSPCSGEQGGQWSRNVAAVSKELATQFLDHRGNRRAIIDIAWSQAAGQQLASIIDSQVQLEAKEPAHAALATSGICRKDAVLVDPFRVTDAATTSSR
jgi:hypothetical protein